MTKEEANKVLGDVSAYLASRASLENEMLAGHTFTDICKAIKVLRQESCEPKTGHWIDDDGDNAICSCCNRLNHLHGEYCKYCGERMAESEG